MKKRFSETRSLAWLAILLLGFGSALALPTYTRSSANQRHPADTPPALHTWSTSGPLKAYAYDLAIAPSNPDILYAVSQGGIVKSTDRGDSAGQHPC